MINNFYKRRKLVDERIFQTIDSFASLPERWWYGAGGPIAPDMRSRASALSRYLKLLQLDRFEAFPSQDGEILVTAAVYKDTFYEVLCRLDGTYDVEIVIPQDVISEHYGLNMLAVVELIAEYSWRTKYTTASFTPFITAMNKSGSAVSRSNRPAMVVQLSAPNAWKQQAPASARIFKSSTVKEFGANHQYFAA